MKQSLFLITLLISSILNLTAQNKKDAASLQTEPNLNPSFSKANNIREILKRNTGHEIPGAAVAIYSASEGWWGAAAGYSRLEDKTAMTLSHLQYLQSVSKTFMAVAILKLQEQGKVQLDAPMVKYLPVQYRQYIQGIEKITVRMLLNHTSGIADYCTDPEFLTHVIQAPLQISSHADCLQTIADDSLEFTPGSQYSYSNSNYRLLALIADSLTGNQSRFITKNILEPLNLKNTFYLVDADYPNNHNLVNSYWDVLSNGKPANISKMQQTNVASYTGDDGLVTTPLDAVKFMKALMEGKLLSPASMTEMQRWVKDKNGNPVHGMGLFQMMLGDMVAYGHGGSGIGAGCLLLYVPSKGIYIFLAVNLGVLAESKATQKVDALRNELLGELLK